MILKHFYIFLALIIQLDRIQVYGTWNYSSNLYGSAILPRWFSPNLAEGTGREPVSLGSSSLPLGTNLDAPLAQLDRAPVFGTGC
jgi:hypothetical protein